MSLCLRAFVSALNENVPPSLIHPRIQRLGAAQLGDLGAGVETLALGDIEYYKSVETSALLHTTLFISNRAELNAAMAYYAANGSSYIEVLIDPTYKPTAQDFIAAYQLAKPGHLYSITYNNEGRVFVAYFVEV